MARDDSRGVQSDVGLRLRMQSEERRIASQHERLDALCREVFAKIDKFGAQPVLGDYLLFMSALDAHMKLEEEIYFPALHGIRADASPDLSELVAEHVVLRRKSERVRECLKASDRVEACITLEELARQIETHEQAEEELIARITEGPAADYGHSSIE